MPLQQLVQLALSESGSGAKAKFREILLGHPTTTTEEDGNDKDGDEQDGDNENVDDQDVDDQDGDDVEATKWEGEAMRGMDGAQIGSHFRPYNTFHSIPLTIQCHSFISDNATLETIQYFPQHSIQYNTSDSVHTISLFYFRQNHTTDPTVLLLYCRQYHIFETAAHNVIWPTHQTILFISYIYCTKK